MPHWHESWGTPLHVLRYIQALDYQKNTHGSLNSEHRTEWILSRNLGAVWGEEKIRRLERLATETPEAEKDVDWNMHFDRLYHEAIREWAESVARCPRGATRVRLIYFRPTRRELVLDGQIDGSEVTLQLSLVDLDQFPLLNRGFRWVQEYPFNP